MTNTPAPLTDLPRQINAAHAAAQAAVRDALGYAAEAGRLLLAAKAQLPHGRFGAWVAEHCEFAPRTARLYMAVARRWPELEAQAQNGNALPLREAHRLLGSSPEPDGALAAELKAAMVEADRLADLHRRGHDPEWDSILAALPTIEDKIKLWKRVFDQPMISPSYRRWRLQEDRVDEIAERLLARMSELSGVPLAQLWTWNADDFAAVVERERGRLEEWHQAHPEHGGGAA